VPLSNDLRLITMTFECPDCGLGLVKNGNWFRTAPGFTCEGCGTWQQLAYDDKVALFEKYRDQIRNSSVGMKG
jgi:transcription initiation factor IIE alpha subunit